MEAKSAPHSRLMVEERASHGVPHSGGLVGRAEILFGARDVDGKLDAK